MARGIMQGVINMFTAGLYHLFEQQLLCIHRTALLRPCEQKTLKLLNTMEARRRLLDDYPHSTEYSGGEVSSLPASLPRCACAG
jgi:hypothetical protein